MDGMHELAAQVIERRWAFLKVEDALGLTSLEDASPPLASGTDLM